MIENRDRVISYTSRALSNTEAKYPAHRLVSGIEMGHNRIVP